MQVRYIADTHLYDPASSLWRAEYGGLDAYAENLICNWNNCTDVDDIVFHLGDVGEQCELTYSVLRRLKGNKVLILGNHDVEHGYVKWPSDIFQGVYHELTHSGVHMVHKPSSMPDGCIYLIHGHHHTYSGIMMHNELNKYQQDTYRLNCAADLIGNTPRTLRELIINKETMLMARR